MCGRHAAPPHRPITLPQRRRLGSGSRTTASGDGRAEGGVWPPAPRSRLSGGRVDAGAPALRPPPRPGGARLGETDGGVGPPAPRSRLSGGRVDAGARAIGQLPVPGERVWAKRIVRTFGPG